MLSLLLLLCLCAGQGMGAVSGRPQCQGRYTTHTNQMDQLIGKFVVDDPCGSVYLSILIATPMLMEDPQVQIPAIMVKEEKRGQTPVLRFYVRFPVKWPLPEITQITLNNEVFCINKVPRIEGFMHHKLDYMLKNRKRNEACSLPNAPISSSTVAPSGTSDPTSNPISGSSPKPDHPQIPQNQPMPVWMPIQKPYPPSSTKPPAIGQNEKHCGRSVRPQALMLGSNEVEKGDWPWLAPLFDLNTKEFKCAGILINKRFVVIAAHCLVDQVKQTMVKKEELVVILGRFNFSMWAERDLQPRQIRRMIIPPEFQVHSLTNDIALLYLDEDAEYTMDVRPVCLWEDDSAIESLVDQEATLVGWNPGADTPRLATVPIVSPRKCSAFAGKVADRKFCAGNTTASKDCIGNGDGGLLVPIVGESGNLQWFLRGIPSSHLQNDLGTCQRGGYVVYTDVALYTAWIREVVRTTKPYDE